MCQRHKAKSPDVKAPLKLEPQVPPKLLVHIFFTDCKGGELKVRRALAHRSNAMWGKRPSRLLNYFYQLQQVSLLGEFLLEVNIFSEVEVFLVCTRLYVY